MSQAAGPPSAIRRIGRYQRPLAANLDRMLENALDWEHLPWLHASSFGSIELVERDASRWRARVTLLPKGETATIELSLDRDRAYWVTRTLDGPGHDIEIRTQASARGDDGCHVDVQFWAPLEGDAADLVGRGYERLYARLYDEDEAMMVERQHALDVAGSDARAATPCEIALGPEALVRRALPLRFALAGRSYRLVDTPKGLRAHALRCPHWLGPLDDAEIAGDEVVCPWHGYRFALDGGAVRWPERARCRLPAAPRIEIDARGDVRAHIEFDPAR